MSSDPTPVQIGNATLYHGACEPLLERIGRDAADVAVCTDPPYGLGRRLSGGSWGAVKQAGNMLAWDERAPQEVARYLARRYRLCVIWGGNYFALPPSRGWLVWDKFNAPHSMADCELAWTSMDRNIRSKRLRVQRHPYGHPTEKPLELMIWSIAQMGFPSAVFDPYMGVGTVGEAALRLGLRFIGIERERGYFDTACSRLAECAAQLSMFGPVLADKGTFPDEGGRADVPWHGQGAFDFG